MSWDFAIQPDVIIVSMTISMTIQSMNKHLNSLICFLLACADITIVGAHLCPAMWRYPFAVVGALLCLADTDLCCV